MIATLPQLKFDLPEWKPQDFKTIHRSIKRVEEIGGSAGTGSDRFRAARERLEKAVRAGGVPYLITQMNESIDARAFTDLMCSDRDFTESVVITRELLDQLSSLRTPMSRLALTQLIRAYFVHYDQVAVNSDLEDWCHFLKLQLKEYGAKKGGSELKTYAKQADLLFQVDAPHQVVQRAIDDKIDFDTLVQRFGLTGFTDGRYLTLCRYQYYLQTLNDIPVGDNHPVLSEVCNEDVVNAPFSGEKLLGHAILETLIDRTGSESISQSWQTTILNIAGDPRVPKTHRSYQQWWELLGPQRIAKMRGWLSRLDLKVFLKILQQSAKDGSNTDMERMFGSRKAFMEGLLKQGHVAESRLFLSDEAVRYLRRHYKRDELPSYARVSSSRTSMIYLNIGGKVHMIEGSHSFKLKLMDRLPVPANVTDYGVDMFRDSDFRTGIGYKYYREFPGSDELIELTHDVHLNWQHKAIEYLRGKRIEVEVGKMIDRTRLREYKQKYGSY
jgi:EH_Signature domain